MANGDTLTPASPESTSAFLGLDEAGRQNLLGKLSPDAKQALLLSLRTLSQSKEYGTTTGAGYKLPGETSERRYPTVRPGMGGGKGPLSEITEQGVPEAAKTLSPGAKWVGAGIATAALGPEAGLGELALASELGGAAGEATKELGEQATGLGEPPKSAKESALNIGKAGLETASAEFLFGGITRTGEALARHLNPYTQGIQSLFRSFGPPSSPEFRDSLETAAFDLQRIYSAIDRKLASPQVRGGVINEDMRFRVTLDAVNNYLRDMYQQGRAAQIAVGQQYGARIVFPGNPNVIQETAHRLSRSLPTDSVAQRAATALADNPLRPLPIAEADELARAVNVELRKFEGLTGSEQAALRMSSKIKAGLKELDTAASQGLNSKLREIGQPGLEDYERRYAALSRVREQLEKGMNKSEAVTWNQRLHSFFSLHGINIRSHFGAFETPGSLLEEGLSRLGKAVIPESGEFRARPPRILEGELMPPEEETGLTRTPPSAGPPPPSGPIQLDMKRLEQERTKGLLPPPKFESPHPEYDVSPPGSSARKTIDDFEKARDVNSLRSVIEKATQVGDTQDVKYATQALERLGAQRRAAPGVSPTGTERRKTIMPGVTTAYDLPTEGEKLAEEVRRSKGPSAKLTPSQHLLRRAAEGQHVPGTHYTDEGLRRTFNIPHSMRISDLVDAKAIVRNSDGTFSVAEEVAAKRGGMKPPPKTEDFDF